MAKPSPEHSKKRELIALGRAIKKLRLENSVSQESLAHEANIDRSYLGGIERGEHNLSLINIIKIAQALEISTSKLFQTADL